RLLVLPLCWLEGLSSLLLKGSVLALPPSHLLIYTHTQPCLFWRPYFHFFCNTECSGQPSFFPLSPSHTHPHQYHAHVCTHSKSQTTTTTTTLTHSCSQTQPPLSLLLKHPLVTHTHTHTSVL